MKQIMVFKSWIIAKNFKRSNSRHCKNRYFNATVTINFQLFTVVAIYFIDEISTASAQPTVLRSTNRIGNLNNIPSSTTAIETNKKYRA